MAKKGKKKKSKGCGIKVAVRVRPLSKKELESSDYITEVTESEGRIVVHDPSDANWDPVDVLHRSYEREFSFQNVFGIHTTQERVHRKTTEGIAKYVLQGHNATVFAYGATGSGKTYTMLGTKEKPGVVGFVMHELFTNAAKYRDEGTKFDIKISYLEVYNERIRDLLNLSEKALELRESKATGVVVAGLSQHRVKKVSELMGLLLQGNLHRKTEGTAANAVSSRSHAVFQVYVTAKKRGRRKKGSGEMSKLSLVDLAGSERASATNNRGVRLREGAKINRSLLSLANCVNAIVSMQQKGGKVHIPFRDSKLTRLLKDSLGGNCRTVMIAAVRPHKSSFKESLNTLKYASRASNIKTVVRAVGKDGKKRALQALDENAVTLLPSLPDELHSSSFAGSNPLPAIGDATRKAQGRRRGGDGFLDQPHYKAKLNLHKTRGMVPKRRARQKPKAPESESDSSDDSYAADDFEKSGVGGDVSSPVPPRTPCTPQDRRPSRTRRRPPGVPQASPAVKRAAEAGARRSSTPCSARKASPKQHVTQQQPHTPAARKGGGRGRPGRRVVELSQSQTVVSRADMQVIRQHMRNLFSNKKKKQYAGKSFAAVDEAKKKRREAMA